MESRAGQAEGREVSKMRIAGIAGLLVFVVLPLAYFAITAMTWEIAEGLGILSAIIAYTVVIIFSLFAALGLYDE